MTDTTKVALAEDHGPALAELFNVIDSLLAENGCPWDKKQTARSMVVKMLEETYELVDAVSNGQSRMPPSRLTTSNWF